MILGKKYEALRSGLWLLRRELVGADVRYRVTLDLSPSDYRDFLLGQPYALAPAEGDGVLFMEARLRPRRFDDL